MVNIHAFTSSDINCKFASIAACACAYPLSIPLGLVNVGVVRLDSPPFKKLTSLLYNPLIVYGCEVVPITLLFVITG